MTAVAPPRTGGGTPGRASARGGRTLAGTATMVRFFLRRDRVRLAAWLAGLTLVTVATAGSFSELYPTEAQRQAMVATLESPAMVAMSGVNYAPQDYHYGVMMGHQMLWFTALLAGLLSVLLVVRHTRAEESAGRAELVRSGVIGRHAPLTAALLVVVAANVALAALLAVGLGASGFEGIDWGGSWLYGAAHAAVGIAFAGVAAVTAQVSEHSRAASGLAIAVLGLSYVVRAVGDLIGGGLSWLSPLGWAQATHVYAGDRWWALLPALPATVALVAVAVRLSERRDLGAGLRAPKPGPRAASSFLSSPLGFAVRLQRANLIGWCAGVLLLGVSYGSVLGEAEQMLVQNEAIGDLLPDVEGVAIMEAFASMITTIMAILSSIYAVLAALKLRSEENSGRAEPVLATALSRTRWVAAHLAVALAGGALVLLCGGLGLGAAGAASTGDASLLPRLLGAALAHVPALWVVVGVVVALFGLLPRAVLWSWALVAYAFVVVYLGGLLQFPAWMNDLSPFGHVPQLPAEEFAVMPLVGLVAVAAVLVAAGSWGFRRRDVQSTT